MNEYTNEHEQWEAIKTWWKENGTWLIIVVSLSLAASFGWRYWQQHQLQKSNYASQLFTQLLSVQATDSNDALIPRIAGELEADYPHTPYAPIAALFEAKIAADKNDLNTARQKLQWAFDHAKDKDLRAISQLRLARVTLALQKPQLAMALLDQNNDLDKDYIAIVNEIKGDVYLTQGEVAKARQAYQDALNAMPASEPTRAYVEMQLYRLPK